MSAQKRDPQGGIVREDHVGRPVGHDPVCFHHCQFLGIEPGLALGPELLVHADRSADCQPDGAVPGPAVSTWQVPDVVTHLAATVLANRPGGKALEVLVIPVDPPQVEAVPGQATFDLQKKPLPTWIPGPPPEVAGLEQVGCADRRGVVDGGEGRTSVRVEVSDHKDALVTRGLFDGVHEGFKHGAKTRSDHWWCAGGAHPEGVHVSGMWELPRYP